tara:strand:- start:54 stop:470 length:417 start_codon:yes stop_codon:yes gene_type:complete
MNNEYGKPRIQVRCNYDDHRIHIQGVGEPTVNRKYGIALELRAPISLTGWLAEQTAKLNSPASGNQLYIEMEVCHYPEADKNQLLIHGTELNHPEGAMLNISTESGDVKVLMDFVKATASGLRIMSGPVFKSDTEVSE